MSKKITHIVGSFYPAIEFGGPIFSTKRICDVILDDSSLSLEVITFNFKNAKKKSFLSSNDLDFVNTTEKYNVKWIDMRSRIRGFLSFIFTSFNSIRNSDVVHLTGVFNMYAFVTVSFCFFFRKKLVISARGSLQALYEFKDVKNKRAKLFYLKVLKFFLYRNKCYWLATTEFEAEINNSYIFLPYFVATNPVDVKSIDDTYYINSNNIVFLSRLSQKKGIERFISVSQKLKNSKILIAGDGDTELKNKVLNFVNNNKNVKYYGVVRGKEKDEFFRNADVLLLPSYSENFGIVIAEALSSGCSVVTTVNQPWKNYSLKGVLHVLPVNSSDEDLKNEILTIQKIRNKELKSSVQQASNIIKENFSIHIANSQVSKMYESILN